MLLIKAERKVIYCTVEFQQLRRIKQLGGAEYVFEDATNTRFQHSIGTAYLAGLMARALKSQGYTNIDERDVNCIEIATLHNDLDQEPFSHVFAEKILPNY